MGAIFSLLFSFLLFRYTTVTLSTWGGGACNATFVPFHPLLETAARAAGLAVEHDLDDRLGCLLRTENK